MGSILNFVFPENPELKQGPIVNYIQSNYSYTDNFELRDGYKNIIVIETVGDSEHNEHFLNIIEFLKKIKCKVLICFIADPVNDKKLSKIIKLLDGIDYKILSSNISSKYSDVISFDYFMEESTWDMYNHFFSNNINDLGYKSKDININELDNFRNYKFLSFNRNMQKPHRLGLFFLYLLELHKESLCSFLFFDGETPPIYTPNDYVEGWESKLPIELDTVGNLTNFRVSDTLKKELFLDTCIHIVTETSFNENELFLSEKILKPILMYQPFIVLSSHGYLKRLKGYGFKTFSDFWDESYDEIENPRKRYKKVRELILSLNEMSIEEMNKLYQKTKEICIFNRNLHQSMYIDSIPNILEEIENEW